MAAFVPSAQQQRIIGAPQDDDVLVVAGAGSGKTFTMTQRIIHLIETGVAPEGILGLTFTRKAAAELLARVSAAVSAHAGARSAFMKPDVSTYDAFFQSIVRQYGLLVGFDQETQPLSAAGAVQLVSEVIGAHMGVVLDSGEDFGGFTSLVGQVLQLSSGIANAMIGEGCEDIDTAIARIRAWDSRFIARADAMLEGLEVPAEQPQRPKRPTQRGKKGPTELDKANMARYEASLRDYAAALPLWRAAQLRSVARRRDTLLTLVALFQQAKRERHMAEFSDFTIAAFQLVSRFPSIGARYRRRYTHVLLDEYQDTSTTQSALLAKLFHASPSDRAAVSAVGDPYQAIYSFRGASPGAFRLFQEQFGLREDVDPLPLTQTRRNARVVLEAANDITRVLRRHHARPGSALTREVGVQPLTNVDDGSALVEEGTVGVLGYALRGQEIDGVVRFAHEAVLRHRHLDVQYRHLHWTVSADSAPNEGPHVAVLCRSKKIIPLIQAALEQSGLSTLAVGASALLARPEIIDVLGVLRVVADHADSQALMRLLATPRFGLGARDLRRLARLAERLNTQYRYRALVQAGLGAPDADYQTQYAAVREHAQRVPNAVFVADVLMGDDADHLIDTSTLSDAGKRAAKHAGAVLRHVQRAAYEPIAHVIRAAVQALNLDVDMLLAAGIHAGETPNTAAVRAPIDALLATVDTFTQEIAVSQTPTLRGYLAWIDAMGSLEDEQPVAPDVPVDVVLMTVHQSKGLEWDAVAVVDMRAGTFPSKQGDYLAIETVPESGDDEIIATHEGEWRPPEYLERARTWLSDPAAVPVPVRVDAGILPRFPRTMAPGADPLDALDVMESAEELEDEVFGELRGVQVELGEAGEDDARRWALTQEEEYGRMAHADERRLMYVALTRARSEVLLTYSRSNGDGLATSGDERQSGKPSNFWTEVRDALGRRKDCATEPGNVHTEGESLAARGEELPEGFFVGAHAQEFEDAVVGGAWNADAGGQGQTLHLPWPFTLSAPMLACLRNGVEEVREAMDAEGVPAGPTGVLTHHALRLAGDADLGPMPDMPTEQIMRLLRAKAQRVIAAQRLNATTIQANANDHDDYARRDFVRGVLRPIPQMSSPAAQAGTRLHAWAERFLLAGRPGQTATRASMEADVRAALARADGARGEDHDVLVWAERLISSPWAQRELAGAEQSIVAALDGVGNLVQGKLDAVFVGGVDPSDESKDYTVVDWKTGARPRSAAQRAQKLKQLDFYRLLLSKERGVPLERIDGALYYLSEPDEARRQIVAEPKGEAQIMEELRQGVPEVSDVD